MEDVELGCPKREGVGGVAAAVLKLKAPPPAAAAQSTYSDLGIILNFVAA